MALARWKDLCLDALDPRSFAEFWAPVVGLSVNVSQRNVSLEGLTPRHRIWVNAVDRPRTVKNRLHLDVDTASVDDLVALGARVLAPAEDTGFGWTTMADPEGGEFCAFLREADAVPTYRLHGIGIDSADPQSQARWWGEVLGAELSHYEPKDWWTVQRAGPDDRLTLDFARVPEPRQGPNRVHWDVTGEVAALLDHGATRLWDMPDWTVLADPEGNEFCVFDP